MEQLAISKRIEKIESYLLAVGRALPAVADDDDLSKYIKPILTKDTSEAKLLRKAFGLPSKVSLSRSLMTTISLKEHIAAPLISLIAQRLYHFIWRFQFTLRELNEVHEDKSEMEEKVAQLCNLCLRYALAQRLSLRDLAGSASRPIPESAADSNVYAILRAIEYEREEMPLIVSSEPDDFRKHALNLIHAWLLRAVRDNKQRVDDYSNAWWALREGLCADIEQFTEVVGQVIRKFGWAQAPPQDVINKSFVPEIYDVSRCAAYIISNIHAIIREGPQLDENLEKDLDTIVGRMLKILMGRPDSKNVYLASVHHEGLSHVLSFSAEKEFRRMRRDGKINLADFKPIGDFVCVDPEITRRIGQLRDGLISLETKKGRAAVLFYGASSTGKSFLVEQFFKEFNKDAAYSANQFICKPTTKANDLRNFIANVASKNANSTPTPFMLIDEFDVEMTNSLYPELLDILDKGFEEKGYKLSSFVLFLAGGKHGSLEEFRKFLVNNQKVKKYQKGIDIYNRISPGHKISLPTDLYRNKNLRMMVGLSVLLQHFNSPANVSTSVLLHIRDMRVDQGEGVRQFKSLKDDVEKDANGVLVLKNGPGVTGSHIVVTGK